MIANTVYQQRRNSHLFEKAGEKMLDFFYAKKAYSFCLLHTIPVSPFSFFHSTVNWIEVPIQKVENVLWKNAYFFFLHIRGFILLFTVGLIGIITNIVKVEKILWCSLDLTPSPSPSVKIQIMGGKVSLRCKDKTLLGVVNKHLKTKRVWTVPSNVLPYYLM